jgi:imidazolonepropionase-like amidohydrolase
MKPIDAIQAADLIGQPEKTGAVEVGHYDDIGVTGDPAMDGLVLESVKFVEKGGAVARNDFGAS